MKGSPIAVEQTFDVRASLIWQAITDPVQMRQWFFEEIQDFRADVGFTTEFTVSVDGEGYPHLWQLTEVDQGRRITYQWRYGGYPGDSRVSWAIHDTADGVVLILTHKGAESFPQDNPIFSREACESGWVYFIQQSLPAFIRGL